MKKWNAPGCYDITTGGVTGPGEGRLENIVRETEEELGISVNPASMQDAGWMRHADSVSKVWASLFIYRTK